MFHQTPHPDSLRPRSQDQLLAPETRMGAVELLVGDLDAMIRFYHEAVLLDVLDHTGNTAVLGLHGRTLMILRQTRDLPAPARNQAGLFHTAILFDTPAELSASVMSIAQRFPGSFTGSADHLYSEAFYFDDPEGNGVELYTDRPRESWIREENGLYALATDPLDPNAYLRGHFDESVTAPAGTLGHVHLQVGDIPTARRFYSEILGFEVTGEIRSALFVSAGGYHHHMALNTFNSLGAPARAASLGLGLVDIDVPHDDAVAAVRERLADHRISSRHDGRTLSFEDPWNTTIRLKVAED
ncbi:VOC family protein [Curtobacterium sp. S6]|uniref:VOC family protein n=1 Tax=Curtobacterium sp. S6 TaxID=1479623 RepID=UPI0004AB4ADB|nr:VOC family protein [Curtobacterium sp. S6]